jgi:hypothetical protein
MGKVADCEQGVTDLNTTGRSDAGFCVYDVPIEIKYEADVWN